MPQGIVFFDNFNAINIIYVENNFYIEETGNKERQKTSCISGQVIKKGETQKEVECKNTKILLSVSTAEC